jgi:spore germination protein GerM
VNLIAGLLLATIDIGGAGVTIRTYQRTQSKEGKKMYLSQVPDEEYDNQLRKDVREELEALQQQVASTLWYLKDEEDVKVARAVTRLVYRVERLEELCSRFRVLKK